MAGTKQPRDPTTGLSAGLLRAVFWRTLLLQASWNRQRMQNLGLLVSLIPWVRRRRLTLSATRRFCRRHYEYFNTNPYLANFIIGGLLRLEEDRAPQDGVAGGSVPTFKSSLARTFASLGDQLFWLGLKPAVMFLACLFALGERVWPALGAVILFGICQLELRRRALATGYRLGLDIVELLARPVWHRAIGMVNKAGLLLTGLVAGFFAARLLGAGEMPPGMAVFGIMLLGMGLPLVSRRRLPAEMYFLLAAPLAVALAWL